MPDGVTVAQAVELAPRRSRVYAALVTIRPRQWLKNALVIAAPGAAGALGRDDVPVRVGLACIAFCLLASGIYAVNDVRDIAEDRAHPRKRYRPVAAGELEPGTALALGAALMLTGLALCAAIRPLLLAVGAGYLALSLSYTALWRGVVILDVVAIAGGFVLRAIAGGVAAPVTLSRWFIAVVTFSALFVAAGKRLAELQRTARDGLPRPGRAAVLQRSAATDDAPRERRTRGRRVLLLGVPATHRRRGAVAAAHGRAVRRVPSALRGARPGR